jgi:transketolase
MPSQTDAVRRQFADTLLSVGTADEKLVVMVGDISHGILQPFAKACPGRYFNIGILEPTMISMAAGLSSVGLRVVAHTIAPFIIERSFEQLKLDFVYQGLSGNIVTVGSAFDYSNLGCTHHCYGDFALLKTLPGVEVTHPASPAEFDALFRQAYADSHLTVYRIAGSTHGVDFRPEHIVLGKGIRLNEGKDLTLIATGPQLRTALEIREELLGNGVGTDVIYIHTIRPLDTDLILASVEKTRRVVVIEEHMRTGGLGDDVLRITRGVASVKYYSASIPDIFVHEYGSYEQLCDYVGLNSKAILVQIRAAGLVA